MLGRSLKFLTGSECAMANMADGTKKCSDDIRKELIEELDIINKSLKGNLTIEDSKELADIPTNNSRGSLFSVIKELYEHSKKASYIS